MMNLNIIREANWNRSGVYKIFFDDLRDPTDIYPDAKPGEWLVIRNIADFKDAIETIGVPTFVSFDNDLGVVDGIKEECKEVVKWIVFEKELDISGMDFKIHSANSSGVREYMTGTLNNWKKELRRKN